MDARTKAKPGFAEGAVLPSGTDGLGISLRRQQALGQS